jgi:hypothetical protein
LENRHSPQTNFAEGGDDAPTCRDQLEHVGVFLLRHDRRPGGERIRQLEEAELRRAPQNPFLGPAAEMCGDEGQTGCELNQEVAIARDVEAVGGDAGKSQVLGRLAAVDRQGGAGECGCAQGGDVDPLAAIGEAVAITLQLFAVGEPVVRGDDGLSALQMRVAWQDDVEIGGAPADEGGLQLAQQDIDAIDGVADVELEVGGDLIVAAAAGVELAADVAEPRDERGLDVHVDVFQLGAEGEGAALEFGEDVVEGRRDLVAFAGGEQTDVGQHAGMGLRAADVDLGEAGVEADRFGERLDQLVGGGGEPSLRGICETTALLS